GLRPLRRELQPHALVGQLVEPNAGRDGQSVLEGSALLTGLGCRTRLATQLPAGVDERRERVRLLEDPDQTELLDPEAEARLELDHLHEDFFLGLVVDGEALARTAARHE